MIHETAIIHPTAKLARDVKVGPWSIIGEGVEIGERTEIGSHVVIKGPTKIGCDNKFFPFSSIGEDPQDKKYQGEMTTLEIGDRNIIRESCTFNRGTIQDQGITKIGHDNLFMAYVHVAHDCIVGNSTIFANNASLAGHVIVEDFAILSGFSGVLQFCRVGAHSFASMGSLVGKDLPPYVKVSGYHAKPFGLNTVGLQRRGFTAEAIQNLRRAYRILYRKGLTLLQALEELRKMECPEVDTFVKFVEASTVGIVR